MNNLIIKKQILSCLCVVVALLVIVSCKSRTNNNDDVSAGQRIEIQYDSSSNYFQSQYFDSLRVVPLETTENSLIRNIDRIAIIDSSIYILDRSINSLFLFNEDGKFIKQIGMKGRGPDEYEYLSDFAVNRQKDELVLLGGRRFLFFDLKGTSVRSLQTDMVYGNVTISGDFLFAFPSGHYCDFYVHKICYDTGELLEKFVPRCKLSHKYPFLRSSFPTVINNQNIYFQTPFGNTVFEISDGTVKAKYLIDFGENNIPEDLDPQKMPEDTFEGMKQLREKKLISRISNFIEFKQYIFFTFQPGGMVIYDKTTNTNETAIAFDDKRAHIINTNIFAHDGDPGFIISIQNPPNLGKETIDFIYKYTKCNHVRDAFKDLDEISNPVLFKYYY